MLETFDAEMLAHYAKMCGIILARSHAKQLGHCTICGYLGSGDQFDNAMAGFAMAYADQAERDYDALKSAVKIGKIKAYRDA
jgi:hypothetical protein